MVTLYRQSAIYARDGVDLDRSTLSDWVGLGRRNWLFAGSNTGGERAAALYSILQTAKLNNLNPEAYLADTLARIAAGHPINRIDELMPWAHQPPDASAVP